MGIMKRIRGRSEEIGIGLIEESGTVFQSEIESDLVSCSDLWLGAFVITRKDVDVVGSIPSRYVIFKVFV